MINFTELPQDGRLFEQFIREMLLILDLHPQWTGVGPDQGRDIIATEKLTGVLGNTERIWLVQCKHFAHGNRSVGREDVGAIVADSQQVGANGYLLVCSTHPSAGLMTKLRETEARPENKLVTQVWDSVNLEKKLQEPRFFSLGHIFFPLSLADTPWKLYNRGSPNMWTAHYKGSFIHISSRVAGSHPNLEECESVFRQIEAIGPLGESEFVRLRAIYFDDVNSNLLAYIDYLVPHNAEPRLRPSDFARVLNAREDLGYYPEWDVEIHRIYPFSDHFAKDHYSYYDNQSFFGSAREHTIDELTDYGNQWR